MPVVGRIDQYASMLVGEFDDYSMSENLHLYSEQFDNAAWVKSRTSVTANSSIVNDPNGTQTADLIQSDLSASPDSYIITQTSSTNGSGNQITFSVFLKYNGYSNIGLLVFGDTITADIFRARFDIQTGTIVSSGNGGSALVANSSITAFPNGWYRCSVTGVVNNTDTSVRTRVSFLDSFGNDTYPSGTPRSYYLWGAQLERGTLTDYTPTTTTAVTRVLPSTTNTSITGLGTYYSSGFSENIGVSTFLTANVFRPYDIVYDDFGGTLFGAGQGRYMRQNSDKSVIVYNEIDEITPIN